MRTRLKPQQAATERVAVVSIGQGDIEALEGGNVTEASLATLKKVLQAVLAAQPAGVGLVIPHHDVDYDSPDFSRFLQFIEASPEVYLASFDLNFNEPTETVIPRALAGHHRPLYAADSLRKYKREVVRSLPLLSFRGSSLVPHLPTQLALDFASGPERDHLQELLATLRSHYSEHAPNHMAGWHPYPLPAVRLNYFLPPELLTLPAAELVESPPHPALEGRVVLIGYTAFRKRDFVFREGTHVNTPWEGDMTPEVFGYPLIYVLAVQLQNLLMDAWLREAGVGMIVSQTLLAALVSYFAWRTAPFIAVIIVVALYLGLFYGHTALMAYGKLWLPLADALLFSLIAMIIGAFERAHAFNKRRALAEFKAHSQRQLALIQSRFLNRFAFALFDLNAELVSLLARHSPRFTVGTTMHRVFHKAISSGEELRDYLSGIKHYALLMEEDSYQVQKRQVFMKPLLSRVLNQFETLLAIGQVDLQVVCGACSSAFTDELLLEPIVFNLVSNAIKYSPPKGQVRIKVAGVNGHLLSIAVSDEGPGIAEEFHSKVFEKFYRIKTDQVYEIKGNGLGLYLCQYFARKIGAVIRLESALQRGCTFTILVERGCK